MHTYSVDLVSDSTAWYVLVYGDQHAEKKYTDIIKPALKCCRKKTMAPRNATMNYGHNIIINAFTFCHFKTNIT